MQTLWCFDTLWQNFDRPRDRETCQRGLGKERASLQAVMLHRSRVHLWQGWLWPLHPLPSHPAAPAPLIFLSICPWVLGGYIEREEPGAEKAALAREMLDTARWGLAFSCRLSEVVQWCHLLGDLASPLSLPTLNALLSLARLYLLTWYWASNCNSEQTKEECAGEWESKERTLLRWQLELQVGMVLGASQAAPSPGREAGCCFKSRLCSGEQNLPSAPPVLIYQVSWSGGWFLRLVGRMVPTQVSLLSCGTQGWQCSQMQCKMHIPPQFCMKKKKIKVVNLDHCEQSCEISSPKHDPIA